MSESGSTKPLTDPKAIVKPGPFHVFSVSDSGPAKPLINPKAIVKPGHFHTAEPSTKTGKQPPTIDKGKDSEKEKQTPHSPERSGSVSTHHEGIHIPADSPVIAHPQTPNSERRKATPSNRSTSGSGTAGPSKKAQGKRRQP